MNYWYNINKSYKHAENSKQIQPETKDIHSIMVWLHFSENQEKNLISSDRLLIVVEGIVWKEHKEAF